MGRLADIFRDFCHSFGQSLSVNARFRQVKSFDDRLGRLFDDTPELRPRPLEIFSPSYDPSQAYDWKPWSRYLWAIAIPPLRMELWRWFLGRSYTNSRYAEARQICLTAARDTIAVRLQSVPVMYQKNWHVSSYTVIAGIVLAIELSHAASDDPVRQGIHTEVEQVLKLLKATLHPTAMVKRGIEILSKMLKEAEEKAQPKPDFSKWVKPSNDQASAFDIAQGGLEGLPWEVPNLSGREDDLFDMLLNTDSFQWQNTFPDSSDGWA